MTRTMKAFIDKNDIYVYEAWKYALTPLDVDICSEKPKALDSKNNFDLWYEDYDSYDFDNRDKLARYVYSYVYRKAITRKNYLDSTIKQYRVKRPDSILHTSWPEGYFLELDYAEFLDDSLDECWDLKQELIDNENGTKLFIIKPALGDRAHGIHIFRTQNELQTILDKQEQETDDDCQMREYLVQEYIADPQLFKGHKFHLRVYVVAIGKLKVYLNKKALMLCSGSKYDPDNHFDLKSHLTNTCYQGEEAIVREFDLENGLVDCDSDFKVPLNVDRIYNQIKCTITDLFEAAIGQPMGFQPLPNAFEFYGLDFLVTSSNDVKLLEVNAYPDFKQTGPLKHVVYQMFADTARILLGNGELQVLECVLDS